MDHDGIVEPQREMGRVAVEDRVDVDPPRRLIAQLQLNPYDRRVLVA